jgi:hypothetical protein
MASTFAVTRNHLIFGLCLPLAVLLGYMLADIDDPASRLVIVVALSVLAVPVLMRWHHPLLILSWNMVAQPALPGNPQLWMVMSLLSLFIAVLNRSVNSQYQFAHVPALTRPLLVLTVVVLLTAFLTGGVGLRIFGSNAVGGRGYFFILAAVAGFFALSSRAIPPQRALLCVALFFLPGLTALVGRLAGWLGPKASFLYFVFPGDFQTDEFVVDPTAGLGLGEVRVGGAVAASLAIFCWLLARYGIAGIFDLSRPWRLLMLAGSVIGGLFGGFRSALLLMVAIFFILFTLEKLWRTRISLVLLGLAVLVGALLLGFADRLPLSVQRTLSFLPIKVDPVTKEFADSSTQWRLEMWRAVLPEVPKYLLKGKGYSLSSGDLFMSQVRTFNSGTSGFEAHAFAGDYHNGPLSVVIPFGAAGLLAFGWLVVAGARFLYTMYQECAPELRQINALLLALFLARVLLFFFIFGSLFNDLYYFTGILGFSVALNVSGRRQLVQTGQNSTAEEGIG